jgi:hypothetical protein
VSWSRRWAPTAYSSDIPALVVGLSSYDTSDHDLSTYAQIIARIGKYVPVLPLFGGKPYGPDISSLLA